MVRLVEFVPPPPPPPPLSPPPQAATPRARAVTRQLAAASERARKVVSLLKERDTEAAAILCEARRPRADGADAHQPGRPAGRRAIPAAQGWRFPGRNGATMRAVAATRAMTPVIRNESIAFTPIAQRTSQMTRPAVVASTRPIAAGKVARAPREPGA